MLGRPVVALIGVQADNDSLGMPGAKLVLKVERYPKALCDHLSNGVGGYGRIAPVVSPVGPRGGDRPRQRPVVVCLCFRLQLREEPGDAVGVLRLSRPRLNAVAHVTPAAPVVGGEGGAPDAPCGGELGAVPVRDVAYALGGQRVANVAAFAVTLNEVPSIGEAVHHLADPALGDA